MAKATITQPGGAIVTIEGTPEEVEVILSRLNDKLPYRGKPRLKVYSSHEKVVERRAQSVKDYIIELREGGLFKKPRGLSDVRVALAAEGHILPITTLSARMLELVKSQQLRRVKEGKVWKYVNR